MHSYNYIFVCCAKCHFFLYRFLQLNQCQWPLAISRNSRSINCREKIITIIATLKLLFLSVPFLPSVLFHLTIALVQTPPLPIRSLLIRNGCLGGPLTTHTQGTPPCLCHALNSNDIPSSLKELGTLLKIH